MTNKSFIVIQNLVVKKVKNEIDAFLKNSSIESDNREDFDDVIDFDVIFVQNINFFDVIKSVANKIDLIEINKIIKRIDNKVNDEINDEMTNDFENEINSLNNANS